MDFLFPFINFLQPGIAWPDLAVYRPLQIAAVLTLIVGLSRKSMFARGLAFGHPVFKYLVAFVVVQVLSVYYSGLSSMLDEFGFWFVYLMFVVLSVLLVGNEDRLRRYIWGAMTGSMAVVGYGLYAVYAELPAAIQGRAGAYGMYENHNDYSFLIIMILPFLVTFRREERSFVKRALLGASILACIAGIAFSLSRGGMLALVLEIGLLALFASKGRARTMILIGVAALAPAAIAYQWTARAENQGDHYTAADAENSRFELWRIGQSMVISHPLLGVGSRRFGELAQDYGEVSGDNRGKNAHNTYIQVIATSGLLGISAFLAMLTRLAKELRKPIDGMRWAEATRQAALVALYSIAFRALLDAKPHDWSFYFLASVGLICIAMRTHVESARATAKGEAGPARPDGPMGAMSVRGESKR